MNTLSRYNVKYKVVGNSRKQHTLQIQTVGLLTRTAAKRLVAQSQSLPRRAVEIVSIKEAK